VKLVGEEILTATDRRLRQLRATQMAMIFQEPMTALNPVVHVGRQIDEVLRAHTDLDARPRLFAGGRETRCHQGAVLRGPRRRQQPVQRVVDRSQSGRQSISALTHLADFPE
jgi:ABC-type microcin C transport system duplicated ATPase subunit YejF